MAERRNATGAVQALRADPQAPGGAAARRLSNYLLDARFQLRYVLIVTLLSATIAGVLGYMIYRQEHHASAALEEDLQALTGDSAALAEFRESVVRDMRDGDRALVVRLVGVGLGLMVILSGYLVVMTHKVAGPLYKVTGYFDRMADGKLGRVTDLRKGDMLQDFYGNFREMHDAVRSRLEADAAAMARAAAALRAADAGGALAEELARLDAHVADRRRRLS